MMLLKSFILSGFLLGGLLSFGSEQAYAQGSDVEKAIASLQAEVAELRQRVQANEDINEISNLQRIYGYYVDKGQWEQVANLFSEDGSMEIAGRGVFKGKERILEYLYHIVPGEEGQTGLAYGTLMNHFNLQPVLHVNPDGHSAKGRWRVFMQVAQLQETAMWGEGTYENEYVKEDGVWKISKLQTFINYYVDYDKGWDKGGKELFGEIDGLAPDAKTSVEYKPFPNFFIPPYHYQNPVTGD